MTHNRQVQAEQREHKAKGDAQTHPPGRDTQRNQAPDWQKPDEIKPRKHRSFHQTLPCNVVGLQTEFVKQIFQNMESRQGISDSPKLDPTETQHQALLP